MTRPSASIEELTSRLEATLADFRAGKRVSLDRLWDESLALRLELEREFHKLVAPAVAHVVFNIRLGAERGDRHD